MPKIRNPAVAQQTYGFGAWGHNDAHNAGCYTFDGLTSGGPCPMNCSNFRAVYSFHLGGAGKPVLPTAHQRAVDRQHTSYSPTQKRRQTQAAPLQNHQHLLQLGDPFGRAGDGCFGSIIGRHHEIPQSHFLRRHGDRERAAHRP